MANFLWTGAQATYNCVLGDGGVYRLDSTGAGTRAVVAKVLPGVPPTNVQSNVDLSLIEGGVVSIAIAPASSLYFPFQLFGFSGGVEDVILMVGGALILV